MSNIVAEIAQKHFAIFDSQDAVKNRFDVTFTFKDRELYANEFILSSLSEIFKSLLLNSQKNESIPITEFSYEDFKEFLSFFYHGSCQLTLGNIMPIVHLADIYKVDMLKKQCDDFLIKSAAGSDALKVYEILKDTSLENAFNSVKEYIANNTEKIIKDKYFNHLSKEMIIDIVKMENLTVKEEVLFEAIFKWAESKVINNAKTKSSDSNTEDWIKFELYEILPYIRFPIMNVEFLNSFVVPKDYLFSSFKEINKIIHDATIYKQKGTTSQKTSSFSNHYRGGKRIQITDGEGSKAYSIIHDHFVIEVLQKTFNRIAMDGHAAGECFWDIALPEVQNGLNDDVLTDVSKYYLVRDRDTTLALKLLSKRQQSYCFGAGSEKVALIAEVFPESRNFLPGYGCKYQIV